MQGPAPAQLNKTVLVAERETAINCMRISGRCCIGEQIIIVINTQ